MLETSHVIIGNLGYLKSGKSSRIISFGFKREVSFKSISFIETLLALPTILVIYSGSANEYKVVSRIIFSLSIVFTYNMSTKFR